MGVNGGSGNTISFQQLQDYYGGSHPIGLNEYYRGGLLVPSSVANVISNGAVSASGAANVSLSGNQSGVSVADTGGNNSSSYVEIRVRPSSSGSASFSGPSYELPNSAMSFAGNSSFVLGGSASWSLSANTNYTLIVDLRGLNDYAVGGFNFTWSSLGTITYTAVTRANTSNVTSGSSSVNTNVPGSGQITLNTFNSPGSPSP